MGLIGSCVRRCHQRSDSISRHSLNAAHEEQVQLWMSRIESKASSGDDGQEEMEKKPDCDRCKDNCNKKCKCFVCVCGGGGGERSRTQTNRSCAASVTWPSTSGYLAMDSPFTDVPDDEDWCVCLHVHMGVR